MVDGSGEFHALIIDPLMGRVAKNDHAVERQTYRYPG